MIMMTTTPLASPGVTYKTMSSGPPHSLPQRLRFSEFFADIVRFIN